MSKGRTSRRCFLGFFLLVTIAILSVSNVPLAHAEEVAEAVVDATGDVEVQAEEDPVEAGGPVEEEEPVAVDEPVEEEEVPVVVDEAVVEEETNIVDEVTDAAKAKISEIVEDIVEDIEEAVEEAKKNIVSEVTDTAKSKISEIVTQIKDASPQQKKKIAAGALGVWGAAAGAGWVLNNLGGSDE
eukprot:CAMPEP_0201696692 /NCGR_PEP_ID=MMETSP0578-20130828/8283_1 /ASSEMBLY_ACC=CAM_ASM_000663 /TAXON_ID=267565 /ORGANISM="Skeletonema grethea, Strain CCMP 1804" /LENGTH=184 /DNA_ID=CAMNT_0048182721 /DNA_START=41 /DNA_END=595 /DNA_ORIENTATION=-